MKKSYKMITIRDNGTTRVSTINKDPAKTDTSFKDDCDINFIVAKFRKTGQISHLANKQGVYADVSELPDLMAAGQAVRVAEEAFMELPAKIRQRFQNDPQNMIEYLKDPENKEEATKLGLLVKKETPAINDNPNDEKSQKPKTIKKAPNTPSDENTNNEI